MKKNRLFDYLARAGWKKWVQIMKLTAFLILLFVVDASALFSQSTKISVKVENGTLSEIFSKIEAQSEYRFFYQNEQIRDLCRKTVDVTNKNILDVVNELLKETELSCKLVERNIIIFPKSENPLENVIQQSYSVSGKVTDSSRSPLPGVSVVVKGTTTGTITDADGKYSLANVPENATLQFSFVGMTSQQVVIGNRTVINVTLAEETVGLEEVVAVGYGSLRKKDVTGAISSITAAKLVETASSSPVQAIQGKVAGIMVSQDGWRPGAESTVRIRGNRSFSASNDPLYVIDGIPIERGLNEINPNEIESMEILKDASATAVYGSRGANGVVLITTKRGKSGKSTITYDGYYGIQQPVKLLEIMNGAEFADFVREAYRNRANVTARYNSAVPSMEEDKKNVIFGQDSYVLESVLKGYDDKGVYNPNNVRSFDWVDAVMRTGVIQNHQLNITGGNDITKLMISAGYFENKGLQKGNDYLKYNFRVNIDHQLNKRIKIGTSTLFSFVYEKVGANLYDNARNMNPLATPYDAEGNLIPNPGNDKLAINPLANVVGNLNDSKRNRIISSGFMEANLFNGLKYRFNVGLDYRTARDGRYYSMLARNGALPEAQYGGNWLKNYTINNILYYDKIFKKHRIGATLLHEIQDFRNEQDNSTARGIPAEYQEWYNLGAASELVNISSNLTRWRMLSYMGRLNYSFNDNYIMTVTGRYDGSSVLAQGHKYQFFPSLSLAWRISGENFMKGFDKISDLKLRMGYGRTGNSSVSPYQTQGSLSMMRYVWDEKVLVSYAPGSIPNPDLSWETTDQINLGLDYSLFNNRLSGAIELYRQNTHDLIMNKQIPVASGFDQVLQNIGKTRNSGFEMSVSSININGKNGDFTWKTDLNFSTNKEEIVELYNGTKDDIGNKWFIGKPLNLFYDYEFGGIWQNTPEDLAEMAKFNANGSTFSSGLVRVVDQNGDHKITSDDRKILGQARPKWYGGITNYFSYKGIDLSFQWYSSWGNMAYSDLALRLEGRWNSVKVDYWTPTNASNAYPKPSADWETPPYINLTYYQDASFIRLKFVTLGYTVPKDVLSKFSISNLRVYATAQNPILITNFNGLDPEGGSGYSNPSTKTFMFGLNVSF